MQMVEVAAAAAACLAIDANSVQACTWQVHCIVTHVMMIP